MATLQSPAAQAARPRLGLIVLLGALTAFGAMSIDLYLPSLPTMGRALRATQGEVGATLSAFLVGVALGQPLHGPLSDRIGRRPPLLAGIALYVAASVAGALATSVWVLIAARFAQGLGGCAALVISRAVVRDRFATNETARVFSMLTLVLGVAPVLAPLGGSGLLAAFGWRAIFWALAGFGTVAFAAVALGLPETRAPASRRASRATSPLATYAALLRLPALRRCLLAIAFSGASLFVYVASSSTLFIGDFGLSPIEFSGLFASNAFAFIGAAQLNRIALRHYAPARIAGAALAAAWAIGAAFALTAWAGAAGLWVSFGFSGLTMAAYGFAQANLTAETLAVDPANAGAVAALAGTASFAVGAAAAAVAATLHDGTARPPATVIALAATIAAVAWFSRRPGRTA